MEIRLKGKQHDSPYRHGGKEINFMSFYGLKDLKCYGKPNIFVFCGGSYENQYTETWVSR